MQIKVKDTRMHKLQLTPQEAREDKNHEIPVAEAELILLGTMKNDLHEVPILQQQEWVKVLKPILISRTEKIEDGDYFINSNYFNKIRRHFSSRESAPNHLDSCKILALPEHFSPKHLQAIVDGKMKEGDKVLVECINEQCCHNYVPNEYLRGQWICCNKKLPIIKLNSSNNITLHKKEEKMYSREELQTIAFKSYNLRTFDKEIKTTKEFKEWFDQTIK